MLTRAGGGIYSSVIGYAGLSAPFDSADTCNLIWRLHAADAAFRSFPMLYFNVCSVPETDIKSIASVNLSGKGILSLIAFLVQSEVLHPFLNNLK